MMYRELLPVSCHPVGCFVCSVSPLTFADYYQDEKAFLARVEEDATTFRPTGQLIHTYTRPVSDSKGKGVATLDPESDDAVVFEVYHVRALRLSALLCSV